MDLSFYPLTLEAMDQANADSLCLFVGEDERPLTGLAGLADWRLSGALSGLLRAGLLKGVQGEALLTPARRLPFRKLFLFGIGSLSQPEHELAARVAEGMRKLAAAGVEEAALQLPLRLPVEVGIRTLVDAGNASPPDGESPAGESPRRQAPLRALVFGADPAALVRALSQAASRGASATHERRVVKVQGPPKPAPPSWAALPHRAAPTEIPRAAPLPFTPSNAGPVRRPEPEIPPSAPAAVAVPPAQSSTSAAPWARPIALPVVKVAPIGAPPPPLAPAPTAPVPPSPPAAVAVSAESLRPAPPKAQRYVPPQPAAKGGGKKRKR